MWELKGKLVSMCAVSQRFLELDNAHRCECTPRVLGFIFKTQVRG